MGSIWEAEDELLRAPGRGIKVLAENLVAGASSCERFEREARTAASLSGHPNVVTIYDVGEHDGRPSSSWSTCPARLGRGPTSVRRGPPSRQQALVWLRQAPRRSTSRTSTGLCTATSSRQTSCSTSVAALVIADFGIARAAYDDAAHGERRASRDRRVHLSRAGAGRARETPRSDRYSLAVVAFRTRDRRATVRRRELRPAGTRHHLEDPSRDCRLTCRQTCRGEVDDVARFVDWRRTPPALAERHRRFVEALAAATRTATRFLRHRGRARSAAPPRIEPQTDTAPRGAATLFVPAPPNPSRPLAAGRRQR